MRPASICWARMISALSGHLNASRKPLSDLLEVGYHRRPKEWIKELLDARDRTLGGENAQPNGLYLVGVAYDPSYGIPSEPTGPLWF